MVTKAIFHFQEQRRHFTPFFDARVLPDVGDSILGDPQPKVINSLIQARSPGEEPLQSRGDGRSNQFLLAVLHQDVAANWLSGVVETVKRNLVESDKTYRSSIEAGLRQLV